MCQLDVSIRLSKYTVISQLSPVGLKQFDFSINVACVHLYGSDILRRTPGDRDFSTLCLTLAQYEHIQDTLHLSARSFQQYHILCYHND